MVKVYLLGGESVLRRSAKEVNEAAFEDAGGRPEVLVFPWARPSFDNAYGKRELLNNYLRSLGAGSVDFVDYSDSVEKIANKMAASGIVYLTGGQPSILIERLKAKGVDGLLRGFGGVVVGRSAGALALCSRCISTTRRLQRVRIVSGLGLVNITLKAHYVPSDEATLKGFSLKEEIFALPEKSALVCENAKLSVIGTVYLFSKGKLFTLKKGKS